MNSLTPISITLCPPSFWKWGMECPAMFVSKCNIVVKPQIVIEHGLIAADM
jgi:hypothetical protein